jgi:hypothetical protein
MFDAAWITFLAVTALAFVFFFFKQRQPDFLNIAYIGAVFYFSPLFWDRVLQSSPDLISTIQPAAYLIATAYVAALVLAAIISDRSIRADAPVTLAAHSLSWCYLALAVLGLAGALVSSKGAIINADKVEALKQFGYFYLLFEIAACLACISAAVEGNWRIATISAFLLAFDLLAGFRAFVVLTSLSVAFVMLTHEGRIRLYRKIPTYGVAAVALLIVMLFVHSARFAIFEEVEIFQGHPDSAGTVAAPSKMRGDTLQYIEPATTSDPTTASNDPTTVSKWISIPLRLFKQSEPFIIQATLVGVIQRNLSCSPSNILKSLFLLAPPGFTKFVPNPFPPTFYDEYQPKLYPNATFSTGGNIWAEMLCRFGYVGIAIFGVFLNLVLIGFYKGFIKASSALATPIALSGVIVAFYIHRNDLHYTLVLVREVWIVFVLAYGVSVIAAKIQRSRRKPAVT